MTKRDQFATIAASFHRRRGLLVEFGPTITPCTVSEVVFDEHGMEARIVHDDGTKGVFGGRWDIVYFDADFWQVSYANARIVFDAEAVRRFDAGEALDIDDYL